MISELQCPIEHLLIYTDGAQRCINGANQTGAGFSIIHNNREIRSATLPMGKRAEVFDAEMLAIAAASLQIQDIRNSSANNIKHVHIFTDNVSALQAIHSPVPGPAQTHTLAFRECAREFLAGGQDRTLTLEWIPSHHKIPGNERADRLAKRACAAVLPDTFPPMHHYTPKKTS